MLLENLTPVPGDEAGNDLKWNSLVLTAELYVKTGNYSLLRESRLNQAIFTELEGKDRISLSYYLMVFYSDLNGFLTIEQLKDAKECNFDNWKSYSHVDAGIVNKIALLRKKCGLSQFELKSLCRKAFVPALYQCHLFTIEESFEILIASINAEVDNINSKIDAAERRFLKRFQENYAEC